MEGFIPRHRSSVTGVLSGFDRIRIRGTLRWLCYVDGFGKHLSAMKVLLKDFKAYALGITDRVRRVLLELRFEIPDTLLQLHDSRQQRRPELSDDLIPLPTPPTLRLRRHFYVIGSTQRHKTHEQGGVNGYAKTSPLNPKARPLSSTP